MSETQEINSGFLIRLGWVAGILGVFALVFGAAMGALAGVTAGQDGFEKGFDSGKQAAYQEAFNRGNLETRDTNERCKEAFGESEGKAFGSRRSELAARLKGLSQDASRAYRLGLAEGLRDRCPKQYAQGLFEGEQNYANHFRWELGWRSEVKRPWWKLWGEGENVKIYERAQLYFKDFRVGGAYEVKRFEGDLSQLPKIESSLKGLSQRTFAFSPEVKEVPLEELDEPQELKFGLSPQTPDVALEEVPEAATPEEGPDITDLIEFDVERDIKIPEVESETAMDEEETP